MQFWGKALADLPSIPDDLAQGNFDTLHDWLRSHIYVHGRKYFPTELVERVTGEPLQYQSFMRYLRAKYSEIYGL